METGSSYRKPPRPRWNWPLQLLGAEPGAIAKTLSFLMGGGAILILTEGTARIDNHKFKQVFHTKAKMIPGDQVETLEGHAPGGVCPFGAQSGGTVYLDEPEEASSGVSSRWR